MPIPITIHVGDYLECIVTWDNVGTTDHAFDLAFGVYDSQGNLIMGGYVLDQPSKAGQKGIVTHIISQQAAPNLPGTYLLYVSIGDYDPSTGQYTERHHMIYENAVTIVS
jgi:hypothetical protein